MIIINKTIYFKSSQPFFTKEMKNIKNNTIRTLDDIEGNELIKHKDEIELIAISSVETGLTFVRELRDISFYADRWIFTWND
ncbi:MAG: hypothetical protein PHQ22_10575 [Sulfuricurvum sp.]|nr:hypothetical protein [Sulfuricurvum sp.]